MHSDIVASCAADRAACAIRRNSCAALAPRPAPRGAGPVDVDADMLPESEIQAQAFPSKNRPPRSDLLIAAVGLDWHFGLITDRVHIWCIYSKHQLVKKLLLRIRRRAVGPPAATVRS